MRSDVSREVQNREIVVCWGALRTAFRVVQGRTEQDLRSCDERGHGGICGSESRDESREIRKLSRAVLDRPPRWSDSSLRTASACEAKRLSIFTCGTPSAQHAVISARV